MGTAFLGLTLVEWIPVIVSVVGVLHARGAKLPWDGLLNVLPGTHPANPVAPSGPVSPVLPQPAPVSIPADHPLLGLLGQLLGVVLAAKGGGLIGDQVEKK